MGKFIFSKNKTDISPIVHKLLNRMNDNCLNLQISLFSKVSKNPTQEIISWNIQIKSYEILLIDKQFNSELQTLTFSLRVGLRLSQEEIHTSSIGGTFNFFHVISFLKNV